LGVVAGCGAAAEVRDGESGSVGIDVGAGEAAAGGWRLSGFAGGGEMRMLNARPELLRRAAVLERARIAGVGERMVREWIATGELPKRIPQIPGRERRAYYRRKDLERLIAAVLGVESYDSSVNLF
jgi:hypothetical protein